MVMVEPSARPRVALPLRLPAERTSARYGLDLGMATTGTIKPGASARVAMQMRTAPKWVRPGTASS
jgi:hypothetical protein